MAIWDIRRRERVRERGVGRKGGRWQEGMGRRIMGSTGETKIREEDHISDPFLFLLFLL